VTTLTIDLSTLDEELENLLAHRWTAQLVGARSKCGCSRTAHRPLATHVLVPPPSETVVRWHFWRRCHASGLHILRDDACVRRVTFPLLRIEPGDEMYATITLRGNW